MTVNTGLSVTCAGHLISCIQDPAAKRATIVVTALNGHHGAVVDEAVSSAARFVAERAKRVLAGWEIVPYAPIAGKVLRVREGSGY